MYISITKSSIHPSQLLDHQTQVSEQATILFHICSSCDRSPPDSADTERSTGIVAAQSVEFSVSGHIARLQWCGVFGRRYEGGWSLQVISHALFSHTYHFPLSPFLTRLHPRAYPPLPTAAFKPGSKSALFCKHQIRKQNIIRAHSDSNSKTPTTYSQKPYERQKR